MGFLFQALYGQNARLLFVFVSLIVMYMREDQMRFISQISKLYQKHNDFVCWRLQLYAFVFNFWEIRGSSICLVLNEFMCISDHY